jgi:hypothetical protein
VRESISQKDCQNILEKISLKFRDSGVNISPRELDNAIWNYQRNIKRQILLFLLNKK